MIIVGCGPSAALWGVVESAAFHQMINSCDSSRSRRSAEARVNEPGKQYTTVQVRSFVDDIGIRETSVIVRPQAQPSPSQALLCSQPDFCSAQAKHTLRRPLLHPGPLLVCS
jgi:hypothetical protein